MSTSNRLRVGALSAAQHELEDALERGAFGQAPSTDLAVALRLLGEVTRKLGRLDRAAEIYAEARRVARAVGKPHLESGAVEGLALVATAEDEVALAVNLYDEAAALAMAGGDEVGHAVVLSNKANLLIAQERFEEAASILREALSCEGIQDIQRAAFEDNMSIALAGQGEHEQAIAVATEAAALFGRLGAGMDQYQVLCHLEKYRRDQGHTEEAASTFVEAHDLIADVEAKNLDVAHYGRYRERVQRIEAETRLHLEAEGSGDQVWMEIGINAYLGDELTKRGELAFESGDYVRAERDLLNALEHWKRLKALHVMPRLQHALGMVYTETGQIERAREHLIISREMAHQLGDAYREMGACANLARFVLDHPGDAGELDGPQLIARAYALRRLAFNDEGEIEVEIGPGPPTDGGVIESLDAGLCADHGAFDLAEAAARRAIDVIQPVIDQGGPDTEPIRYRLALRFVKLYSIVRRREKQNGEGKESSDALAARLDELMLSDPSPRTTYSVQATLGSEMFRDDHWDEKTLIRLLKACDAYEEIRERALKVGELGDFAGTIHPPFAEAVEVAVHLDRAEQALHLLERSKSRSLLEALDTSETQLREELLKSDGDEHDPSAEQRALTQPATVSQLSAALASRTSDPLLIEFFFGPRNIYAFTLDGRGKLETHHLGKSTEEWAGLENLVRKNSLTGAGSALEALRHPTVRTLADFVQIVAGSRPVYISPHRVLHALPLHLILDDGVLTPRPRTYHLPSGSLLRIGHSGGSSKGAVVGGDPLRDLHYASLEASAVAKHFEVPAITGADCTPDWLASELGDGRAPLQLVHLACHALFNPRRGERSGIVLTDGEGPAVVSVRELSKLTWNSDLVVLSACSSGQHEVRAGDELAGISRTLLGRGARALIVALWEVPDLPTYLLIERFYSELSPRKEWMLQTISDALAGAQRAVRDISARDLIGKALSLNKTGDDPSLVRCALSAAATAHSAAGNREEALRCIESLNAFGEGREPAPDIGALRWDTQAQVAQARGYEARPFIDPVNWAAFTLVGRR